MRMFKVVSNKYFQFPEDKSSVSLSSLFQCLASKRVVLSPCPLLRRQQYNSPLPSHSCIGLHTASCLQTVPVLLCRAKGAQKWACEAAMFPAYPVFLQAYRALPTCQISDWKVNACKVFYVRKHADSFSSKQVQEWLFCPLTSPWSGSEQVCLPFYNVCTCVAGTPRSLGCVLGSGVWAAYHKTSLKTPIASFLKKSLCLLEGEGPWSSFLLPTIVISQFSFAFCEIWNKRLEVNKRGASVQFSGLCCPLCCAQSQDGWGDAVPCRRWLLCTICRPMLHSSVYFVLTYKLFSFRRYPSFPMAPLSIPFSGQCLQFRRFLLSVD